MQVYKAILKILNRRRSAIIIYAVIFFVFSILLASASESTQKEGFSQNSIKIAILNQDSGILGGKLVNYLSKNNEIKEVPENNEKLLDEMYYREIEYVLRIPENFSETFEAGEREGVLDGTVIPGGNSQALVETEIDHFLKTVGIYLDSGNNLVTSISMSEADMDKEGTVQFLQESDNMGLQPAFYYFNFQAYVYLCIVIVGIGPIIIIFKKKDIDARNKCSSMSFGARNLQVIFGCIAVSLIFYLIFMGMACNLYPDYMFSMKGLFSAINSLLFMLLSLSVTFLIGQFMVRDDNGLQMIGNVIGLAFSFLGGVFVSLDLIGENVKQISRFIPSYWYVTANNAIQKIGVMDDWSEIYQSFLIIFGFTMAFLAMGMLVNRMKARN